MLACVAWCRLGTEHTTLVFYIVYATIPPRTNELFLDPRDQTVIYYKLRYLFLLYISNILIMENTTFSCSHPSACVRLAHIWTVLCWEVWLKSKQKPTLFKGAGNGSVERGTYFLSEELNLIHGTHIVDGEHQPMLSVLWSPRMLHGPQR